MLFFGFFKTFGLPLVRRKQCLVLHCPVGKRGFCVHGGCGGGVVKEGFYGYGFVNILKKRTVVRSGFFCLSVTVTCTFGILPPFFLFEIK